jgi:hypothetical protein
MHRTQYNTSYTSFEEIIINSTIYKIAYENLCGQCAKLVTS